MTPSARLQSRGSAAFCKYILTTAFIGVAAAQPAGRLSFEVASVKPTRSQDFRNSGIKGQAAGRLTITNVPLYRIILAAYHIKAAFNTPRLSGGPDWIRSEGFDIEAVPPQGAIPAALPLPEKESRSRRMLQSLLADRFKLAVRSETKEIPAYVLSISAKGPKLTKSNVTEDQCDAGTGPADVRCHGLSGGIGRGLHGKAVSIADICGYAENWADRPIVDQTGLTGLFEVDTEGWAPLLPRPRGEGPEAEALADPTRPTLFMIFEKLGLKLEAKKAPVEVYSIEHVERPGEN
jgi:uncharacterized protein (TIGR03435 family)